MSHYSPGAETRERLLEAAAEVFAEHGYRDAKVQAICRRANANAAAVNYHFGDKERLYAEVIRYAMDPDVAVQPSVDPAHSAEEQLGTFVRSFMNTLLGSGRPAWHAKLMAKEIMEPTSSLDYMVENCIRPLSETLNRIVSDLVGPSFSRDEVLTFTGCIIGQCIMYQNCQAVVGKLSPTFSCDEESITRISTRITEFSLAALTTLSEQRTHLKSGGVAAHKER